MILNPQQKRPQAHCRGKRQPKLRPALQTHRSVLFVLVLLLVATLTVPPARAHVFDRCDTSSYAVFPTSFSFDHAQTLRNYSAASDGSWAQLAMQVDADGLWEVHAFVRCGFNTTEHPDFNSTGMVTQVHAVPPRGLALTDTLQAGYVGYGIVRPYAIRAFQEPDYLTGTLFKALAEVGYIHGWACNASTPGSLCGAPYAVGCTPTTQEFIEPGTYACAGDFGNLAGAKAAAMEAQVPAREILLFNKWSLEDVEVSDIALADYIAVKQKYAVYLPHTAGRYQTRRFKKAQCPIVERLVNALMKHGRNNGKKLMAVRIVKHCFEIMHVLTDQNPVQILVDAVINAGPREDSTRIGSAGTVRRQAVDVSPLRRVNVALWLLTTGARESAFRNVKTIAECLADELINAAKGSSNSFAIKKKDEIERVAKANR